MHDPALIVAGVVVTLAFFILIGFIVWVLSRTTALSPPLIRALAVLVAALPAILYALYAWQGS